MKKEEKNKILNHQKAIKLVEEKISPIIVKVSKEWEAKFGSEFIKNQHNLKLSIKEDSLGNPKFHVDFLGDYIPQESYKEVNPSQIGDSKFITTIKENQFKYIGLQLLRIIRSLDPKGKLKKSESTHNKFTNYHIKENKIYYNDNWNFVSLTIQNDGIKVNIYTGKYSPNKIQVIYENPYPYFKISDSYQIEDAKLLIQESYNYKYKQYFDI